MPKKWSKVARFLYCLSRATVKVPVVAVYANKEKYSPLELFYIRQDTREETVEAALQVLIITLDQDMAMTDDDETKQNVPDNLFLNYLSRIHREEVSHFVISQLVPLINFIKKNHISHCSKVVVQTILPNLNMTDILWSLKNSTLEYSYINEFR